MQLFDNPVVPSFGPTKSLVSNVLKFFLLSSLPKLQWINNTSIDSASRDICMARMESVRRIQSIVVDGDVDVDPGTSQRHHTAASGLMKSSQSSGSVAKHSVSGVGALSSQGQTDSNTAHTNEGEALAEAIVRVMTRTSLQRRNQRHAFYQVRPARCLTALGH